MALVTPLRKVTQLIFDQPALYQGLRTFFLGGLPYTQPIRLLNSHDADVILDVGCGAGDLAGKIKFRKYYGFDRDPKYIQKAAARRIPNAVFSLKEIKDFDFQSVRPTKAILLGVLHHLSDREARDLLKTLAAVVSQWIVTFDPVYREGHWLNNLLCRLDRGRYVRREEEMGALVPTERLALEKKLAYSSNTKITKYLAMRLIPKAA